MIKFHLRHYQKTHILKQSTIGGGGDRGTYLGEGAGRNLPLCPYRHEVIIHLQYIEAA